MIYETETGLGYFVDGEGRVVDRFDVPPGEHRADDPRTQAVDVDMVSDLPDVDPAYQTDAGQEPQSLNRQSLFLDAGGDALTAYDSITGDTDIPPHVGEFCHAILRMEYLTYVQLAGDENRIQSFEDRFFP